MANPYCTFVQLLAIYDRRQLSALSNDDNARQANEDHLQSLLDMSASELDSTISGRWPLPLPNPIPAILTKWVAIRACDMLYARRNDAPKGLAAEKTWADTWIEQLRNGQVSLPNIARSTLPVLQSSNFKDGQSQFDNLPLFDLPATPTSTSKGK